MGMWCGSRGFTGVSNVHTCQDWSFWCGWAFRYVWLKQNTRVTALTVIGIHMHMLTCISIHGQPNMSRHIRAIGLGNWFLPMDTISLLLLG